MWNNIFIDNTIFQGYLLKDKLFLFILSKHIFILQIYIIYKNI